MEKFAIQMAELFARDYSTSRKVDIACCLACKEIDASSVAILTYSGKEDCLLCRGRYINTNHVTFKSKLRDFIPTILKNISVYEFLYAAHFKSENQNCGSLYRDFQKDPFAESICEKEFENTCISFNDWQEIYESYKLALENEKYCISNETISGDFFLSLIEELPPNTIRYEDLTDCPPKNKQICMTNFKNQFGISIEATNYIALPLMANERYFGVLRFLLPAHSKNIVSPQKGLPLEENIRKKLQFIAKIISLHLEAHLSARGHQKIYKSLRELNDDQHILFEALSNQCDTMADIIESRGAIIRRWNKQEKSFAIVGFSTSLKEYIDSTPQNDFHFFKEINKEFSKNKEINGIHFNCQERPYKIEKYSNYDYTSLPSLVSEPWDIENEHTKPIINKLLHHDLINLTIIQIPRISQSYITFLNSRKRKFIKEDFALIFPAIQNLSLEWQSYEKRKIDSITDTINNIHQKLANDLIKPENSNLKSLEQIKVFIESVEETIDELNFFAPPLLWQYLNDDVPGFINDHPPHYIRLINQKKKKRTNSVIKENLAPREIRPLNLNEDIFIESVLEYFKKKPKGQQLSKIITIKVKDGYDYFDIPFFNDFNLQRPNSRPQLVGILTLIFKEENREIIGRTKFFQLMQLFSTQLGIAWKNLQEKIFLQIQERIDRELRTIDKCDANPSKNVLNKVSAIIPEEFNCDVCLFYRADSQRHGLKLEGANIPIIKSRFQSFSDQSNPTIQVYLKNLNIRIRGNAKINEIYSLTKISDLENEFRKPILENIRRPGVEYDDIQIEQTLLSLFKVGNEKIGLIKLFRYQRMKNGKSVHTNPPPFSELETNLLRRIQNYIFNIIVSYEAIQIRMQDMRNVLHQVISPLNAVMGHSENIISARIPQKQVIQKLRSINSLSRMAARYARNFQTILGIDSGKIKLQKEKVEDLAQYIQELLNDYQHLIRDNVIKILVKGNPSEKMSISIDKILFEQTIFCILDNIMKYSLNRETRQKINWPKDPQNPNGDVLFELSKSNNHIIIKTINWGLTVSLKERDLIFNREYRGKTAIKFAAKGGKGLGLFLVKRIIEIHGGKICLSPLKHENLFEFEITIPI